MCLFALACAGLTYRVGADPCLCTVPARMGLDSDGLRAPGLGAAATRVSYHSGLWCDLVSYGFARQGPSRFRQTPCFGCCMCCSSWSGLCPFTAICGPSSAPAMRWYLRGSVAFRVRLIPLPSPLWRLIRCWRCPGFLWSPGCGIVFPWRAGVAGCVRLGLGVPVHLRSMLAAPCITRWAHLCPSSCCGSWCGAYVLCAFVPLPCWQFSAVFCPCGQSLCSACKR